MATPSKIRAIAIYSMEGPLPDPRSGKEVELTEYPAIIYKVYPDPMFVGLYVFTDNGMRLLRKVAYSEESKADTWR